MRALRRARARSRRSISSAAYTAASRVMGPAVWKGPTQKRQLGRVGVFESGWCHRLLIELSGWIREGRGRRRCWRWKRSSLAKPPPQGSRRATSSRRWPGGYPAARGVSGAAGATASTRHLAGGAATATLRAATALSSHRRCSWESREMKVFSTPLHGRRFLIPPAA
jgi:hypothetical protein